jgi:hypothetical protein
MNNQVVNNTAIDASMDNQVDTSITVSTGSPTFDDFDAMEQSREEVKEIKSGKQDKEVAKDESEKETRRSDEQEAKLSEEQPEEGSKEEKQDNNTDKPQEDPKEGEIKGKLGDKEVALDKNTLVEVTVNGEKQQVKLQDALNSFSGQKEITRRFTELDKEKKQFRGERDELLGSMNKFKELSQGENKLEAFNFLLDYVGVPRYNFFKGLRENLAPQFKEYFSLSEDERNALDVKNEAEFYKSELSKRQESEERAKRISQYKQELADIKKQNNISDEIFDTRVQEISKLVDNGTIGLKKEEVTPQFVVEYHKSLANVERVENILKEVKANVSEDQRIELVKILNNAPNVSDSALRDILLRSTGVAEKAKVLEGKASSNHVQQEQIDQQAQPIVKPKHGFESFDDFDEY